MRVLVTGATTPLGRGVIERLCTYDDVERVLAVGFEGRSPCFGDPRVHYRSVEFVHARAVRDLVWEAVHDHGIDVVFHAAHHRAAIDRGARVHAQNVFATRELVRACADEPAIRRFVYRSFAEVYAGHSVVDESSPLDLDPDAPQWLRDRVEADVDVCMRLGDRLDIAVLRCAEIFAPDCGSQLWDYLLSRVCVRPLGFDPMLDLLSLTDAVDAVTLALRSSATGIFNIPGGDRLPLSLAIAKSHRKDIPLPGFMLSPLYRMRRWATSFEFDYRIGERRMHLPPLLDGRRAQRELGFVPEHPVSWPHTGWLALVERLGETRRTAR